MNNAGWYTIAAALVTVILSPIITILTVRISSRRTSRDAAEQQEVTVRAKFVTDLTERIGELEDRLDKASKREREMHERYRADMEGLDARWRHLTNNLVMHSQLLIFRLRQNDIDVPDFKGWDQFIAEGGSVRREWTESWEIYPRDHKPENDGSDDG